MRRLLSAIALVKTPMQRGHTQMIMTGILVLIKGGSITVKERITENQRED